MLRILIILPLLLLLLNLGFLDYVYFSANKQNTQLKGENSDLIDRVAQMEAQIQKINSTDYVVASSGGQTQLAANSCPTSCAALINTSIAAIKPTTQIKSTTTVSTINQKGEYYIPLGSGSISNTNVWETIDSAQATLDTNNYPPIRQAYFEAILHTNSGEVKARLYDVSTPYIYAGNEARTDSYSGQLISVPINLQPGSKNYKVQLYSTISTGVLDSARIKLVTK